MYTVSTKQLLFINPLDSPNDNICISTFNCFGFGAINFENRHGNNHDNHEDINVQTTNDVSDVDDGDSDDDDDDDDDDDRKP